MTAVEFIRQEFLEKITNENYKKSFDQIIEQAKEMEKEQMISLLEWIRNNAVEVQGGWQYDNWTYTDKEILEVYYKQSKQQEQ